MAFLLLIQPRFRRFAWLLLLLLSTGMQAQQSYAVLTIPADLLRHAGLVVRRHEMTFEVLDKGTGRSTEYRAVTLLDERAASENTQYFPYDQLSEIEDIEGAVYDATGKLVRKVKKKDITDSKMMEYFVNDGRIKQLEFPRMAFPYTIEYKVVYKHKGLMFYPLFAPQTKPFHAVESAAFEMIVPKGLPIRVKEWEVTPGQRVSDHRWEFRHIKAFEREPFTPDAALPYPVVLTAPTEFKLEGYAGNMSSWKEFGQFIWQLNAGKAQLPTETVEKLKQLTADCPDDRCKVEKVYAYLQDHTRYFYVGLGIGGWQPSPAADVDQFKYGDCKGLSNYTVSMLRALDIPAYYVLIRAGEDEQSNQFPDFPNAWFNHAIACAPLGADTIWLECTDQLGSCGFMSDFTDNRPALLVTPEGGALVNTPRYDERVNTILRSAHIQLAVDGNALVSTQGYYRGIPQILLSLLIHKPADAQREAFYKELNLKDFEITQLNLRQEKGRIPAMHFELQLKAAKFAAASGKRLFVPACALAKPLEMPPADSLRQFPIQVQSRGITEEDNLTIQIPEGYSLENGVEPIQVQSAFGTYSLHITNEPGGKLQVRRKLIMNDSVQPKERYPELLEFFRQVLKADKTRLVLVKGT